MMILFGEVKEILSGIGNVENFCLLFFQICTILLRYIALHTCRCDEMVDVADSKCASSILTPGEKVVAVASLFVYNKIR